MKIAIVAGEKSGDLIGAELIKQLKCHYPNAEFKGLCGEKMQAQGGQSLAQMEKISLFGLEGLFSALKDILAIRSLLYKNLSAWHPDIFIGIDVPDFNLSLEKKMKACGIPVIHYVSPTVWAWRGGRVKKIRASADKILTLFPFEHAFYKKRDIASEFVGHPLANVVRHQQVDTVWLSSLKVQEDEQVIAVLPGSRNSEVKRLMPVMHETMVRLKQERPNLRFIIPAASQELKHYIESQFDTQYYDVVLGRSHDILALCKCAMLASGTAALEAALFAKPMVVLYKVSWLSALVYAKSITVNHFSMPNHLIHPPNVPELIQEQATADNAIHYLTRLLDDTDYYEAMQSQLRHILHMLDNAQGKTAAQAVVSFLQMHSSKYEKGVC